MRVSENWLRHWVDPAADIRELAEQLTMAGLEVDAIETIAPAFTDVVVAEVMAVEPHPDADKLRVCQVFDGSGTHQVVCGAPNVRVGMKAPLARIGASLGEDMKIRKAKLRGVESRGMLCGGSELGLDDGVDGLMELPADAPVGENLAVWLGLDDSVLELDITPNRGDCFSMLGIAREVAALNGVALQPPVIEPVAAAIGDTFEVRIDAPEHCARYAGRVVRNVDLSQPVPAWLAERLRRAGLRSIDPVVDVTNYVLLELGQPMHAFDFGRLAGGIVVRLARAGEKLALLDGQEIELDDSTLVIADHDRALALAGIMGGTDSAVGTGTVDIFFESAFFVPERLSGKARGYGLHTDSSHRFERGVDPAGQVRAVERATQLLLDIAGGQPGPVIVAEAGDELPVHAPIELERSRLERVLGMPVGSEVAELLARIGCDVTAVGDNWRVTPPSWRFDIVIDADLIEEVARLHGYNRLPVRLPRLAGRFRDRSEAQLSLARLREQLVARGYQEAITYSFVAPQIEALFGIATPVALENPISADMAVMRTSLWPGLLDTVRRNLNRQHNRVRLFEAGLRFVPGQSGLDQTPVLAGAITGRRYPEAWWEQAETADFFDLKGDVEALLALVGTNARFTFEAAERPGLHPGQTALLRRNGADVGWLGAVHPNTLKALDIDQPVYVFEIVQSALTEAGVPVFAESSRFPAVRRDIAVVVKRELPVAEVDGCVRESAGENLIELTLFDIYEGKGIEKQGKSLALGLTFQDPCRTLNDDEINKAVDNVVRALERRFGAILRK